MIKEIINKAAGISISDEPTNKERANRIVGVMHEYCHVLEGRVFDDDDSDITDMLADVMHFCEQKGFNFKKLLAMAHTHWAAETNKDIVPNNEEPLDILQWNKDQTKEYRVKWEIDIIAKNPRAAAEEALNIQRNCSEATVFEIIDGNGNKEIIDLEISDCDDLNIQ